MAGMRITGTVVRRVGTWVEELTGKAFTDPAQGGDIGYGTRYIHGEQMVVWLGRYGAREAAAYYSAVGVKWAELSGGEVPEWAQEVHDYLTGGGQPGSVRDAADRGRGDAESKWTRVQEKG